MTIPAFNDAPLDCPWWPRSSHELTVELLCLRAHSGCVSEDVVIATLVLANFDLAREEDAS